MTEPAFSPTLALGRKKHVLAGKRVYFDALTLLQQLTESISVTNGKVSFILTGE